MSTGRRSDTMPRAYPAPEADAARAALARIVASEPFRNAPRLVSFLSFIVETTLAGEAAALKGYTIATQALGRPEDFDPQADPIVRVEAGRLRRALHAYYQGEGIEDPLRIAVPVGSYVPAFEPREAAATATALSALAGESGAEPRPLAAPGRGRRLPQGAMAWAAALTAAAVVLGLAWFRFAAPAEPAAFAAAGAPAAERDDGRPLVFIEPIRVTGALPDAFSPNLLHGIVADALARFDGLIVIDGEDDRPPAEKPHYALKLRASMQGGGVQVAARLTHRPSAELIWSRELDLAELGAVGAAERALAGSIAIAVGQPFGVIFSDLRIRAPEGSGARCLVFAHDTRRRFNEADHAKARDCLEAAVAARPTFHVAHALLAHFYLLEHRAGFNLRPDPLDRAMEAARRAIELAPQSARGHHAMMEALFARGETEAALREGHLAAELNPYSPDIQAGLGARYVQLGRYPEGVALLDRAMAANPARPPWYDFYRFVAAYMQDDLATARTIAGFLGEQSFYGPLARALMAQRDGEAERARQAIAQVSAAIPSFRDTPRRALKRAGFCGAITDRFLADLRAAGLSEASASAAE